MQEGLPIHEIKGHPFIVEVENRLLRSVSDNTYFIEFSDMVDKKTHYEIDFDPETGVADIYGDGGPGLAKVKVLPMVKLDPERVAKIYNMEISELPERDSALRGSKEWYEKRRSGVLPTINIYGHQYFVNLNYQVLEPRNLLNDFISLRDLRKDLTNTYYYGMLDTKKMSLIKYDESKIDEIPKNAVMIRIPNERVLDPFAQMRNTFLEEQPERWVFPVRYDLEARVMDWKDTNLPQLIKQNRKLQKKSRKGLKM